MRSLPLAGNYRRPCKLMSKVSTQLWEKITVLRKEVGTLRRALSEKDKDNNFLDMKCKELQRRLQAEDEDKEDEISFDAVQKIQYRENLLGQLMGARDQLERACDKNSKLLKEVERLKSALDKRDSELRVAHTKIKSFDQVIKDKDYEYRNLKEQFDELCSEGMIGGPVS